MSKTDLVERELAARTFREAIAELQAIAVAQVRQAYEAGYKQGYVAAIAEHARLSAVESTKLAEGTAETSPRVVYRP